MNTKIELTLLTQAEILLAADTLNTTLAGKRRIILPPARFAEIEPQIRPLPNHPGLPTGEVVPGTVGYLYNIPVFTDSDSSSSYMV